MKKIVWLLLILSILFSLASCDKRQSRGRPVIAYELGEEADKSDIVLENRFLELRFIPDTAEIIIKDKARGIEWRSTPADAVSDRLADVITGEMMRSQFSLQYANVSGVGETFYSFSQSIEKGAYEYGIVDGELEVNYTIGNIERTFLIPPARPESEMLPLLENMDIFDRGMIESSYRLYDINNLRVNDDRGALLSQYPDLANENVYVLRRGTPEYMKEEMELFFSEAGYTRDDYIEDLARYEVDDADETAAFTITIRYALDGKSLLVKVPFDKVGYRGAYPVIRFGLLPFMGAGGLNDEGYLFVPDGSGAIINFNNGKYNQISSNNMVYGWNEAAPRDVKIFDNRAPFPAFGIQKNGAALLGIIEEGAAYASVQADVSGRNSSYNRVFPYFFMIHGAIMDISGRTDREVFLYEYGLPLDEGIVVRYTICDNDGYVGMAKEYRSWLLQKYPQLRNKKVTNNVPIAVEIVGAVNKTQHTLGIPSDKPLPLTTYKETQNMLKDFERFGWKNVQVKLNGWFNHSVEHRVPNKIKLIKKLGSKSDFKALVSSAEQLGFDLYPEVDFMFVRDVRNRDGFSLYRDAARYANRMRVEKYPFSFAWYGERILWGKKNYLVRPAASMNMMDNFFKEASPLGLKNIAFRNMGAKLGGDYHEKRHVSREASMHMRMEKFEQLSDSGRKILQHAGFEYSVPWADFIVDMAIDSQGSNITDAAVPFYQIVLSGLVPYTGRAINLAEDYTKNLLKAVEVGAGLYFSFMSEEVVELQETKFRQFYANEYSKWVGDANTLYQRFASDFAGLYGQTIEDHIILSPGVTVTVYEDGTRVIVNSTDNAYNYDQGIINADSYIVIR